MTGTALPEYRVRLFLSVDLVGSTAFKARMGDPLDAKSSPNPAWVQEMARFYRGFPDELERAFQNLAKPNDWDVAVQPPKVWKTIGDEIIFCCRLDCFDHLALCVRAFTIALDKYGQKLDGLERPGLDLKGYAWVAAFPYPNVTVRVFEQNSLAATDPDLPDEKIEKQADNNPSAFDFLGKDIDAGFRMGKNSSASSLTLSIELAALLSTHGDRPPLDGVRFTYSGRQSFKGVMGGRPYPVIAIDVERSPTRRKLRHFERTLGGIDQLNHPIDVNAFALAFMLEEQMTLPWLKSTCTDSIPPTLPYDYVVFSETWNEISKEILEREKSELAAATSDGDNGKSDVKIDDSISRQAQEAVKRVSFAVDPTIIQRIAALTPDSDTMKHIRESIAESRRVAEALAEYYSVRQKPKAVETKAEADGRKPRPPSGTSEPDPSG